MGTTNILDLNNRLEKVEKENVAQNNYNSLKNRPKINGNLLTGNKTTSDLGINADNVMMSDGVTSVEDALDGLSTMIHKGNLLSGANISIPETGDNGVRMIIVKREALSIAAVVLTDYWSDAVVTVYGTLPAEITITKSKLSNDVGITNGMNGTIAYLVIN